MRWRAMAVLCLLAVSPCPMSAEEEGQPPDPKPPEEKAPAEKADEQPTAPRWRKCYEAIDWFVNAEVPDTEARLHELVQSGKLASFSELWVRKAIRDAGGLEDAFVKARRERKLVLWYVPHIEGQHMILPHLLDRYMMVGPLSHPDVTTLVDRRFVAVRLPAGGELGKRFDLVAPAAMEPALLVLSPDGEVLSRVDRISMFDSTYVRKFLVEVVERRGVECAHSAAYDEASRLYKVTPRDRARTLELADQAHLDGNERDAHMLALSMSPRGGPDLRVTAFQVRRARLRGESLAWMQDSIDELLANPGSDALREAWAMLLLQSGRASEARRALQALYDAPGTRSERIGYHLAVAQYLSRDEAAARATWAAVAESKEPSIWAAKADAYARNGSDKAHGEGPLTRGMVHFAATPRTREDWMARVRQRGVHFLLQAQRSDGSWEGPRWGGGKDEVPRKDKQTGYNNIKVAISALCCRALSVTDAGDQAADVAAALERGERLLLRDSLVERGEAIVWTYADAFRLLHFAGRVASLPAHRQVRVRRKMNGWIRHLVAHQAANKGCFRHYVYRSTFVTACVTYCLWHAKQAGLNVPPSVFDGAAKVIESARGSDRGLYGYLLDHPSATRTMKGATGRQPLCEWTLFLLGRRTEGDLRKALDIFDEGYGGFEQARKGNFHIPSLDSTAGYYFFHDFYPACEAARASGPHAKREIDRLLARLKALEEPDGTFLDCGFSYGKCYSTSMALLALEALTRAR